METFTSLFDRFITNNPELVIEPKSRTKTYSSFSFSIPDGSREIEEKIPLFNEYIDTFMPEGAIKQMLNTSFTYKLIEHLVFMSLKENKPDDVQDMLEAHYSIDEKDLVEGKSTVDGKEFLADAIQIVAFKLYILILKNVENNKKGEKKWTIHWDTI